MSERYGAVGTHALDLLRTLRERGIDVSAEGDRLRVVAPRGAIGPDLQEAIRAAKQDLIAALRQELEDVQAAEHRLAPVQERIWLFQELEPDSSVYNIGLVIRIEGSLDHVRLETALATIIERHEPLRTCVLNGPSGVRTQSVPVPDRVLAVQDLSRVPAHEQDAAARERIREEMAAPFDLRTGLPIRSLLLRFSEARHDLLITAHHIAVDGVSLGNLCRELEMLYRGDTVPALTASYSGYVRDERVYWNDQRVEERVSFWRDYLQGAPHELGLPADYPRSASAGYAGDVVTRSLSREVLLGLNDLAQSAQASLFMVLLAAYGAALSRATGQRDMLIGTPLHGRHRAEYADLIGMFVNQAPLRVRVPARTTLRQLIAMTRESALTAMAAREIPFGLLVEKLGVKRDAQRTPLFQTMVNVLPPAELRREASDGVRFRLPTAEELVSLFDAQAKFDATLYAYQRDERLYLSLVYNSSLYAAARMQALLDDVLVVLKRGIATPDADLLDTLKPPSQISVPLRVAGTPAEGATIAEQVLNVARRVPDSVALEDSTRRIIYRDLVQRARSVAALIQRKAGQEKGVVGVLIPHGGDAGVGLLAALLSGRPYVPLDPSYPPERLRYMIEDARVGLILTADPILDRAIDLSRGTATIVTLEMAPEVDAHDPSFPAPTDVAYLLYTSGSTGRPKAVVQTHGNLAEQVRRYANALGIGDDDRLALTASISFDACLMDLWGGLTRGAAVRFIDLRSTDLSDLPQLVAQSQLRTLHVTPTVFGALARVAPQAEWPTVRAVVLGGEPVRVAHVQYFDESFPAEALLYNLYGASEHSFSLGHIIDRSSRSVEIPIGLPVGDVEPLLLNEDGHEDPVRGELTIRSAHTAIRYWNSDEANERAFQPDPLHPGRVLYRTGDLARRRTDGLFVALGRVDDQVKVRGHRIEPAEVEDVLRRHPAIADAGVHAPLQPDGDRVLVACYVRRPEMACDVADLKRWCVDRLPSYLVPSRWVEVTALPRTPSGKVDRRSLEAGEAGREGSGSQVDARDAEEQELLGIWQEVLGVDRLSVTDDFFELGGHSLNATEVLARVRDVLGVEIPLRYFFDHSTIEQCAEWVRGHRYSRPIVPPLVPVGTVDNAPLSFSQERLWFLQQLDRKAVAYNMAGASLVEGPLDMDRLRSAFDTVAMRQEALRTTIRQIGGRPVQIVSSEPAHSFVVVDVPAGEDALERARDLIADHMGQPYDLETGPLFRVMIARLSHERHVIGVGLHHTVSDMWSFSVLARDVSAAYGGRALGPLPVTYRDYAVWQRHWLQGDVLGEQIKFWRKQLEYCPKLELPTDFPRPAFFTFAGAVIDARLTPELRASIQRLAVRHRVTPFMTLFAAYNVLLSAYSGQDDIVVGVPIAGRRMASTESLIGTFVNTLVHRNDLSGDPAFSELLQRVRTTALSAYANQDAPFEVLVKELEPERDTSRAPFFQVLFNVANIRTGAVELDGLSYEPLSLKRDASQFDMSINVGWEEIDSTLRLTYNTSLFRHETAERMLAHYLEILEAVTAEPERRLSELKLPSRRDRALFTGWNDATAKEFGASGVMQMFAQRATQHPDRIAVRSPTGSFTYAELLRYAQGITAELQKAGIGKGDRVAILMERSREMLGALLGILGSGAAYIPVDPAYPEARVRYVLEDSGARVILTHRGLQNRVETDTRVIDLDGWTPRAHAPFAEVEPARPAYVIYTSGSTGKPKGVEVTHGGVRNFLLSMQERPGITPDDVILAITTISFDIAVLELYLPLITGARVVITSEDDALDGRRLAQLLEQEGVTLMQATPATWKLLIAGGWQGKPDLRVLCGGEPLPRPLADELLDRVAELWNMYGPTETTVWSTLDRVERGGDITVGRPIANTTCYVLGDDMQMKPVGVPGELWIGGAGVANGYVNRPDLTEKAFIDSPFRERERIYRTGDLVRWRHDGRLEHLGRLDNQVKVRGFRVELGEVEAALVAHPYVKDAVVAVRDDRLIGYIVPEPGTTVSPAELRRMVGEVLPPYMVPSVIMSLQALPLTPNGKVDRKALPEPVVAVAETHDVRTPHDPTAQAIARIWEELLEIDQVSLDDRFFEIGGHSLLAMEVVARIEEVTGVRPEPRSLFFMTLEELAATIGSSREVVT